ncbi:hypothetical protein R9X47_15850 [Wukongibacter baidiensis]|uniref:hypothetical protein n=1 Tax=Wukongibacter baidiensis TaxID=1723361 RepID=UPI003D7FF2FE
MSNPNNNEKNFIDEVWKKARYFEYLKKEEKKKIDLLMMRKKKLKSLLAFSLGLITLTATTILVSNILDENLSIAAICIYMMSFTLYYEYNFN